MQANLPQGGFGILSGLVVVFIALGVSFEPRSACAEARQEQTVTYTIAFASLAPWDLDVFIANADGSNPHQLAWWGLSSNLVAGWRMAGLLFRPRHSGRERYLCDPARRDRPAPLN